MTGAVRLVYLYGWVDQCSLLGSGGWGSTSRSTNCWQWLLSHYVIIVLMSLWLAKSINFS